MIGILEFRSKNKVGFGLHIKHIQVTVVSTVNGWFCPRTACGSLREEAFVAGIVDIKLHIERSNQDVPFYFVVQVKVRRYSLC